MATLTATRAPASLITPIPTRSLRTAASPSPGPVEASTPMPVVVVPSPTPQSAVGAFDVGTSAGGRRIVGQRVGQGGVRLLLVGGVHAGTEPNTVALMEALIDHYRTTPGDLLPDVSLYIVPLANPDGAANDSRFNANEVDLNRNWACGWQPDAVWGRQPVDPGVGPLSEPETQALAALIETLRPAAALFYHSAASGVFAGNCSNRVGPWRSGVLAAVYGEASGYASDEAFSAYPVTGTAPSWADGLGVPAADVELATRDGIELERNVAAINAVQCWATGARVCPFSERS